MAYVRIIIPNQDIGNTVIPHNNLTEIQGQGPDYIHLSQGEYDNFLIMLEEFVEAPLYIQPTSSINLSNNTYEVGSPVSINFTQTFNVGDSGGKVSEIITKNGVTQTSTPVYNESLIIPLGQTIYGGQVTYSQGDCKLNNIGVEDCTGRIEAGTSTSPNKIITGIYPVFYFKSDSPISPGDMTAAIHEGTATKLVISSTGTIEIPYALNEEYLAIAYPATSTTKTKWKVTELSQGLIPGGVFGAETILEADSEELYWADIDYKIHITPLITNPSAPTIQLLNN